MSNITTTKPMEDFNLNEFIKICSEKFKTMHDDLPHLNIMVAGKTGVGKSTLINAVFGEEVAKAGTGKPVTDHLERYDSSDGKLSIYDTKGFELNEQSPKQVLGEEIINTINEHDKTDNINKAIHLLWYCISSSSDRIEEEEITFLNDITQRIELPVIIVLTKCYAKKTREEMLQALKDANLNVAAIIPVHAIDYEIDEDMIKNKFGLKELSDKTKELLPEVLKTVYIRKQRNLDAKVEHARSIVNKYVVAAAGLAATPVPFSDALTLVPTQITMIAHVTACFDMEVDKSVLTGFVSAIAGTAAMTFLGKTIVSNLLKFIPFVGSTAGGAISAVTAGALTKALGEAYILLMVEVAKGNFSLDDIASGKAKDFILEIIKNILENDNLQDVIKEIIGLKK